MKYMGSKYKFAKYILPIILKNRKSDQYYVEPFVGSASVISLVTGKRIGSDKNKYIIALLKAIQNGWEPPYIVTRDQYYDIKSNKDKYPNELVGFVGFCCGYLGIWFGGYCPFPDNLFGQISSLHRIYHKIQGINFICSDFLDLEIPKNSIIYCDPPYENTEKYRGLPINYTQFWEWCGGKKDEGHSIFISSLEAPKQFKCVLEKEIPISINIFNVGKSIKTKRKRIEKLFTL